MAVARLWPVVADRLVTYASPTVTVEPAQGTQLPIRAPVYQQLSAFGAVRWLWRDGVVGGNLSLRDCRHQALQVSRLGYKAVPR